MGSTNRSYTRPPPPAVGSIPNPVELRSRGVYTPLPAVGSTLVPQTPLGPLGVWTRPRRPPSLTPTEPLTPRAVYPPPAVGSIPNPQAHNPEGCVDPLPPPHNKGNAAAAGQVASRPDFHARTRGAAGDPSSVPTRHSSRRLTSAASGTPRLGRRSPRGPHRPLGRSRCSGACCSGRHSHRQYSLAGRAACQL